MNIINTKVKIDIHGVKCNHANIMLPPNVKTDKEIQAYLWGMKFLIIPLDQHTVINEE